MLPEAFNLIAAKDRQAGARKSSPTWADGSLRATPSAWPRFPRLLLLVRGPRIEQVARDVRVPVRERPVRILLPRPHMQRVEGIQPEAVGAVEQMEQLTVQRRRSLPLVLGLPLGLEDDEFGAGEPDPAVVGRFEQENLRFVRVDVAVMKDVAPHEVES